MATTSLALLRHSENRCTNLGARINTYWQTLGGSTEAQQRSLERYLINRTTADMAAAREALDITKRFLPEASRESGSQIGNLLQRLYNAENELCNTVAQPNPPRSSFENRLEASKLAIESINNELGTLMTIKEADLRDALKPYVWSLEQAMAKAEEQRKRDAAPLVPERKKPTKQTAMEAWHRAYLGAMSASRVALAEYVTGRNTNDGTRALAACRQLQDVSGDLLRREDVLKVPDERLEQPLRAVALTMRGLANDCVAGDFTSAERKLERIDENLRSMARLLKRYSLMP